MNKYNYKYCQHCNFWGFFARFPIQLPVADLGFPSRWEGSNLLFGQIFPENCMKMKKLNPEGKYKMRKYFNISYPKQNLEVD